MSRETPGPFDADYCAVCDEHERTYPAGGICETCEVARLRAEVERLTEDETDRVQDARHAMMLARVDRDAAEEKLERLTRERDAATFAAENSQRSERRIIDLLEKVKAERDGPDAATTGGEQP
jgi:hypothetical protein